MSFNGSGTFQINSSGQPAVAGEKILASDHNALTADIATGLSNCITKDGQTTTTATIPIGTLQVGAISNSTGLASTTYTPTLTNGTNVDASTAFSCIYTRVGNIVTVHGTADIDPTAGGNAATLLGISLPVASNFSATTDCSGVMTSAVALEVGGIVADGTNDRATLSFLSQTSANHGVFFTFSYRVL